MANNAAIKITGIKKAVGDYRRANADGFFSPRYGVLMIDRSTGEVWTDEFYSLGRNEWKEYHDAAICDLINAYFCGRYPDPEEIAVNMANVKVWAEEVIQDYQSKKA